MQIATKRLVINEVALKKQLILILIKKAFLTILGNPGFTVCYDDHVRTY